MNNCVTKAPPKTFTKSCTKQHEEQPSCFGYAVSALFGRYPQQHCGSVFGSVFRRKFCAMLRPGPISRKLAGPGDASPSRSHFSPHSRTGSHAHLFARPQPALTFQVQCRRMSPPPPDSCTMMLNHPSHAYNVAPLPVHTPTSPLLRTLCTTKCTCSRLHFAPNLCVHFPVAVTQQDRVRQHITLLCRG